MAVINTGQLPNRRHLAALVPLLLLAAAAYLRLWRLPSQVVGGDEYHGILAAFEPLRTILTRFQWADNCIPLTAFYRILIKTVGLSDPGLRALPLLAGLLAVVLCALFLRRMAGAKASAIGMFLAATSPLLVYYSRFARPYIIVVFLSFIAIRALYAWLEEGKRSAVWPYVLAAVLAAYFSLPALPGIVAPILWLLGLRLAGFLRPGLARDPRLPRFLTLVAVGLAVLLGIALWFLPAASTRSFLTSKAGLGQISLSSLPVALNLFAGTGNDLVSFILLAVCVYGLVRTARSRPHFSSCLGAMVAVQGLSLAVVRPHAVQVAIVLARYMIVLWPVWVIGISVGLADLHDRLVERLGRRIGVIRWAGAGLLPVLMVVLFFLGPLPWLYRYPNDFTNHDNFQATFDRATLDRVESRTDLFPDFYRRLSMDTQAKAIIEYPFVTAWPGNPYHIYQRTHGRRVLVGRDERTFVVQQIPIMHPDLHLANSVDLTSREAIRRSGASYVLVHKDLLAELLRLWQDVPERRISLENEARDPEHLSQRWYYQPARESAARILPVLVRLYGPPVHEDRWIAAFRVR